MKRLTAKDIVLDPEPILRQKAQEVDFPLDKDTVDTLKLMRQYIIESTDEELREKYDLVSAVGLAAPQIGISKRMFAIYFEQDDKEVLADYMMINPKIVSYSYEEVAMEDGEGCLSIKEEHPGIVYRANKVKVRFYDIHGVQQTIEATGFIAIAIQHEMDHLNGILFYDKIDKENPFKMKKDAIYI